MASWRKSNLGQNTARHKPVARYCETIFKKTGRHGPAEVRDYPGLMAKSADFDAGMNAFGAMQRVAVGMVHFSAGGRELQNQIG